MRCTTLAIAAAAVLGQTALAANMTEWYSRSIYQVMIDRFARTDLSTTECEDLSVTCGGTWAGLTKKLDYIADMGFTAIQISPIVKNLAGGTAVGEAYHGYWSIDNYALNENFGTAAEFKALVDEVHKRDMYLMVDVVVNNMVQKLEDNTKAPVVDFANFNPFNNEEYFHPYCNVTEWTNATNYQDCWLYPYGVALADVKTESPTVVTMMQSWVKGLVANYSIDGLRIDAAKHVNDAFLPAFVEAAGVFSLGEVLTGEVDDMCRYQQKNLLQGMPNYLEFYPLHESVFKGGSMWDLARIRDSGRTGCNDSFALGSFLENHDQTRFGNSNQDIALAANAMAYILLTDGIPTVYQGQEQHFIGGETPANRETLWTSGYNTTSELYVLTKTLNALRNSAAAANPDYITTPSETTYVSDNFLCIRKGPDGGQIMVCINNWSSAADDQKVSVGGFGASDPIVNVLTCVSDIADGTGNVTMTVKKGAPQVFAAESLVAGMGGICNETTDASKAGAASGLSVASGLAAVVGLAAAVFLM